MLRTVITFSNLITQFSFRVYRSAVGYALLPIAFLIVIGTLGYAYFEQWTLMDSLYATIITVTTVGYGDFSPQTPAGRVFAIFFTVSAIGIVGYAISALAAFVIEWETQRLENILLRRRMNKITNLNEHIIVCGASMVGKLVANEFNKTKAPFVIIEADEENLRWALLLMHKDYMEKKMQKYSQRPDIDVSEHEQKQIAELGDELGILYLLDDPLDEDVLIKAGIEYASGMITTLDDDRDNLSIILSARDIARRLGNANIKIISRAADIKNKRKLYLAGADKVLAPDMLGGIQLASMMQNPELGEFWEYMLYRNDQVVRFSDMQVDNQRAKAGETLTALKQRTGQMVVAIKRDGQYIYGPDPDVVLKRDDILIVLGPT
ncbi:MAG: potassium channel family protein [Ardenticatenaceae bacterium]